MFSRVQCFSDIGLPEVILGNRLKKMSKHKLFGPRLKFDEKLDQLDNEKKMFMESRVHY